MTELGVPELSLVVLVGVSGSGKSTFARERFKPTEVISSDFCRGLVADDENDQSATADAFELLHFIVGKRLAAGRLTVVDATNVQVDARRSLVAVAREHDVLPTAIVLDVPESVCRARNASRQDRDFGDHVIRRQHADLRRSLRGLQKEGFRTVHVLHGEQEIAGATITRTRLFNDLRHETGPFDVIGDIHGCAAELQTLLGDLGYVIRRDELGRAAGASHPGRRAIFVGDLVDRGPDTPGVLRLVMGMVAAGDAFCVPGNHENKLVRALRGRKVQVTHGLAESLGQLAAEPAEFRAQAERFMDGLVSHYVLDGGRLVVAHAGLVERYHGRASGRVREFCLYGQTTGETDEYGLPVRYPWAGEYRGRAMVLYGHTPVPEPEWVNNTMCLDTGCVFGGRLTALRYPEREVVSVPADRVYYEPARPFPVNPTATAAAGQAPSPAHREPEVLDIADVTGRRVIETGYLRRIGVREENAAAALEVMSRFAIDPRWLLYLPPTMSPVATSPRPDLLEHPDQAFDAYRAEGVDQVVCEEKHMGSRAVALVCRDLDAARVRFGAPGDALGAVWTRTGGRSSTTRGPLSWLTGSAPPPSRPACSTSSAPRGCCSTRSCCPGRPRPSSCCGTSTPPSGRPPAARSRPRSRCLSRRPRPGSTCPRCCREPGPGRPTPTLSPPPTGATAGRPTAWTGIRVAPFQLLASHGAAHHAKPHAWHLDRADRLSRPTRPSSPPPAAGTSDTTDPAAVAAAADWWQELTDVRRRGHGGQAGRQPDQGEQGPGAAGPQGPRPGVPAHHLRPGLHRGGQPRPAATARTRPQALAGAARVRARARGAGPGRPRRAALAGARVRVRRAGARVGAG